MSRFKKYQSTIGGHIFTFQYMGAVAQGTNKWYVQSSTFDVEAYTDCLWHTKKEAIDAVADAVEQSKQEMPMNTLTLNDVTFADLCIGNDVHIGEHLCLKEQWNGWYVPLIHEHDIERIANKINNAVLEGKYEFYELIVRKDGMWIVECRDQNSVFDHYELATYLLNGELFIEIGNNWCWESAAV